MYPSRYCLPSCELESVGVTRGKGINRQMQGVIHAVKEMSNKNSQTRSFLDDI